MEYSLEILPKEEPSDNKPIEIEIPYSLLQYLNSSDFNVQNLCRLCLSENKDMTSLFSNQEFGVLAHLIATFSAVKVNEGDGLPLYVCELCKAEVIHCYQFKEKCEKSNYTLTMLLKADSINREFADNNITPQAVADYQDTKVKDKASISKDAKQYKINSKDDSKEKIRGTKRKKNKSALKRKQSKDNVIKEGYNEDPKLFEDMHHLTSLNNVDSDEETLCIVQNTGTRAMKKLKITFTDTDSLLEQFETKESASRPKKFFYCTYCSKKFHGLKSRNNHVKQVHANEQGYRHVCEQCKERFATENDLSLHAPLHSKGPVWTCSKCQKQFKGRSKLTRHIKAHMDTKRFSCGTCNKMFGEMYMLRRHERVHTGVAIEKKHVCKLCDKRFFSSSDLSVHSVRHLGGDGAFACECGRMFASRRLLASHRLVHSDAKPYACDYCDRRFRHESTRNTHHRTHTGEKPYVCSACGKAFIQHSNLTLHMRVHTGEKPYTCETCKRCFSSSSSLKSHQRTHTGEKPFSCTVCGKKFAGRDLKPHMRLHTGERPYACHVCPKKFVNATRLRDHSRIHTGEKPFECAICPQKFITKSHLMKHSKSHQKKKKANKRDVMVVREIDYNGSIIVAEKTNNIPEDSIVNTNILDADEVPMEVGELVVQDDNEVKTEILVVDNSQGNAQYQNGVCLTDGVTYIDNDVNYDGEVNLVAVNEGEVSISASSAMLEGATVKLYQLDQSLVQIHSSGGQVTISKITSKMTANF